MMTQLGSKKVISWRGFLLLGVLVFSVTGCAHQSPVSTPARQKPLPDLFPDSLAEIPVADGPWRPARVSWCEPEAPVPGKVEDLLGLCSQYFREGSGTDGMLELELALEGGLRHPLLLMTLGQLYLMAGQGEPGLLPPEGPAADVGDWSRNRKRLLHRAEVLLQEAARGRPADAAIDYLLADVARARSDRHQAEMLVRSGTQKCTSGRGFALLVLYQQLTNHPGKYLGGPGPRYPAAALRDRISGPVVLDLLVSPEGEVRQAVVVSSPARTLSRAAAISLKAGRWQPAQVGKYPVWSWLRVTTSFTLDQ